MNRLGIKTKEDFDKIIKTFQQNKGLFLEGIYTHFATSGINDKYWDEQLAKFEDITDSIDLSKVPIVHMNRSLTLVTHPKIPFCNGTRLGIAMYGMSQKMTKPTGARAFLRNLRNKYLHQKYEISHTTITNNLNLSTAITLYSEVIDIKTIKKGEFVSYGATYIAPKDTNIATIAIGYADGIPKNIKHVSIKGRLYNVIGEVCMDMLCIEVDEFVRLHDKVTLIGGELLPVKKVASECGISSYLLFTSITYRVPRVYKDNGKDVELKIF